MACAHAEEFAIMASNTRGVCVGVFSEGDRLSVEYKRGVWARRWQNPCESPATTQWKELRVVLYWEGLLGERSVVEDGMARRSGAYYIRMAEPRAEGVGAVFYEVNKVEKK